jgi:phage baseplate assembly protein W
MAIYSDIDISLDKQQDGDIKIDEDVAAVFNSLTNIVMTIQGQRRMRQDFAYGPTNYLFEAITESNAISLGNIISQAITMYENRIQATNIHVSYDTNNKLYTATVNFIMLGQIPVVYSIPFILKAL